MKELKNYLLVNGIKYTHIADQCNISIVTLSNYLTGRQEPKAKFLKDITRLYPLRFVYESGEFKMELV